MSKNISFLSDKLLKKYSLKNNTLFRTARDDWRYRIHIEVNEMG